MKSMFRFDPNLLCRGTEEFWVPAVIAAVGAAGQGVNQMNANKRQQNSEVQSIANQAQLREGANSQVKNLTQQIAQNNPQQLAGKETADFVNTLRKNSAGSAAPGASSALAPAVGANSRYNADTATAQKGVQDYGDTNAKEMSAIDSAVTQRRNEALAQQTLGTNLNTIGAESQGQNFVDQLRTQTAGQQNPWVSLFSNMLQKGAGAYASNVGAKPAPGIPVYEDTFNQGGPSTTPGYS
jgi:hypothetical protein